MTTFEDAVKDQERYRAVFASLARDRGVISSFSDWRDVQQAGTINSVVDVVLLELESDTSVGSDLKHQIGALTAGKRILFLIGQEVTTVNGGASADYWIRQTPILSNTVRLGGSSKRVSTDFSRCLFPAMSEQDVATANLSAQRRARHQHPGTSMSPIRADLCIRCRAFIIPLPAG